MELFTICGSVLTFASCIPFLASAPFWINQDWHFDSACSSFCLVWVLLFELCSPQTNGIGWNPDHPQMNKTWEWTQGFTSDLPRIYHGFTMDLPWIYHGFIFPISSQAFSPSPATQAERPASPASVPSSPARSINSTTNSPAGRPRRGPELQIERCFNDGYVMGYMGRYDGICAMGFFYSFFEMLDFFGAEVVWNNQWSSPPIVILMVHMRDPVILFFSHNFQTFPFGLRTWPQATWSVCVYLL